MKIGVMERIFKKGNERPPSIFADARDAGFDGIELCLYNDLESDPLWTVDGARAYRDQATAAGLEVPSIAIPTTVAAGFLGDEDGRRKTREEIRHALEVCREVGAGIAMAAFFGPAEIKDERGEQQLAEDLAKLAPDAERAGVTIAIETALPAKKNLAILGQVGSKRVSNYFDVGNSLSLGYDPLVELDLYAVAEHLPQMHVKDSFDRPDARYLGEGRVPFAAFAAWLHRVDFQGFLILETRPTDDPVAAARRNREYLAHLLEK